MLTQKKNKASPNSKLEHKLQIRKFVIQQKLLKLLIFIGIVQLFIKVFANPFGRTFFDPKYLTFIVCQLVLVLTGILLIWKKSHHTEKLITLLILVLLANISETKMDMMTTWTREFFFIYGNIQEYLYLSMPLAKVSWKYCSGVMIIQTILYLSRSLDYEENSKFKYFPLFINFLNYFGVAILSYFFERHERHHILQMMNFKISQKRFKNLIIDVLPSAALIVKDGELLFTNHKLEKMFDQVSFDGILKEARKIQIASSSAEQINLDQNLRRSTKMHFSENNQIMEDSRFLFTKEGEDNANLIDIINIKNHSEFKKYFGIYKRTNESLIDEAKYLDITISKILWNDDEALFLSINENEMAQKINELDRKAKYKDKLLATVSHDLRTPLNGIIGMIKTAIDKITDGVIKESLIIAERSSLMLLNMINDLLDMSQISNGSLRLNVKSIPILDLVEEVSQIIRFQAKFKGLDFLIENKLENPNCSLVTDPNRLKQIILNLLGNALKFTEKGFIKISVEESNILEEQVSDSFDNFEEHNRSITMGFRIKVEDTGSGIKKEDIPKLFKLFGKLETDEYSTINQTGVGLGLAISQNLTRLLNKNKPGYEISVISEVGRGSCFSFNLLSYDEELSCTTRNIPQFSNKLIKKFSLQPLKNSKLRVLVVEDDQTNIMVVTSYLKFYEDILFDITQNGRDACEKVKFMASYKMYYDIILMDCNMPIMDGFQASKKILEFVNNEKLTPLTIIAMTANASPIDYENCFQAGMKDYISKPFTREKLREIIIKNAFVM